MPYDFAYMWNLRDKVSEQTRQEQTTDTENRPMVARGEGVWGWVEKVRGLRSTSWQLRNSHEDVKRSTGNTVNDVTLCTGPGGDWKYRGTTL